MTTTTDINTNPSLEEFVSSPGVPEVDLGTLLKDFDRNWADAAVQMIKEDSSLDGKFIHEGDGFYVWVTNTKSQNGTRSVNKLLKSEEDLRPYQEREIYVFDSNGPGVKRSGNNEEIVNKGGIYDIRFSKTDSSRKSGQDNFIPEGVMVRRVFYPTYDERSTRDGQVSHDGDGEFRAFERPVNEFYYGKKDPTVRDFLDVMFRKAPFFRARPILEEGIIGKISELGIDLSDYMPSKFTSNGYHA